MTADTVIILDAPLEARLVAAEMAIGPETGASVTFSGRVRGEQERVRALYLECYQSMARRALHGMIRAARARWQLHQVVIAHRIGEVAVGDLIVHVAVTAGHRREAFQACEYLMDYLKTAAPFWKKALADDGDHWVEARDRDQQAWRRWQEDEH
ncbi:MAG: molybdenum cofactor biosynthesis protein MoaE [Alcanivoracaceae bacterium]|jgi:molybdopterin synthase catalytic subunit|nr:molybdenum cofactor biosynthesis protein MoaE [Alcanivoracaceae bacterium]